LEKANPSSEKNIRHKLGGVNLYGCSNVTTTVVT
jgi:hypothetical protein